MRIGVIGDTHNNLRNVSDMVGILNRARVERVIHTGDITQAKVLRALARLDAPLHGVYGNNDLERESLEQSARANGMMIHDGPLELCWAERRILVVHDPLELEQHLRPDHGLAIHGHTHLYRNERIGDTVVFNPGECAGLISGYNAVGLVDLATLCCETQRF